MKSPQNTAQLYVSESAFKKIQSLVFGNPDLECGGILIGNVAKDGVTGQWIGHVDDVYVIDRYGESATFTFLPSDLTDALNYIAAHYREDWDDTKHIVGNFHSHGQFDAFFSSVDEQMMQTYASDEFYLVYSPSNRRIASRFVDSAFRCYDVEILLFRPTVLQGGECATSFQSGGETEFSPKHIRVKTETYQKAVTYSETVQREMDKRFNYRVDDLTSKRVLIVGAGTIGNEIAKNLAYSGVTDLTIVDMDVYKYHNLPRSPMVSEFDVGRNKAFALAENLVRRSPFTLSATGVNADISTLGWGYFKQFDLVLSPVDSYAVRKYVDRGCKLYGKTHITAGTGVQYTVGGRMLGDVIVSPPDSKVCYTCTEAGSMKAMESRTGCSEQPPETQPQVMGFSSTVAGVASSAALSCLLGKFHEYSDGRCKDESGNHLYWKISAAEVGLCPLDAESGVGNMSSAPFVRQKSDCEFHSAISAAGGNVEQITVSGDRTKHKLWKKLRKLFGEEDNYIICLTDWSLVYYLAYNKPSLDAIRISEGSDYTADLDLLPKEHVYKVTLDSDCDTYKIVRIIFED